MPRNTITPKDFRLGDFVRIATDTDDQVKGAYVVRQIADGVAHLQRPYIHLADFCYTGGVIVYTGIEDFPIELTATTPFVRLKQTVLK